MLSEDHVQSIMHIKSINTKMFESIKEHGIRTGSKMFGGYVRGQSDIDVLIPPSFPYKFGDMISNGFGTYMHGDIYQDERFRSLYVRRGKVIYNLLYFYKLEDFCAWTFATGCCMKLKKEIPLDDKKLRVLMFEAFVEYFDYRAEREAKQLPDPRDSFYDYEPAEDVPF